MNPEHLYVATNSQNIIDAIKSGIHKIKLTEAQVLEMRELYANGGHTFTSLGEKYGIHLSTASRIINKEIWKQV